MVMKASKYLGVAVPNHDDSEYQAQDQKRKWLEFI
jgi:hypothetical protein